MKLMTTVFNEHFFKPRKSSFLCDIFRFLGLQEHNLICVVFNDMNFFALNAKYYADKTRLLILTNGNNL